MASHVLTRGDERYPSRLTRVLGDSAPEGIVALGQLQTLSNPLLAFFCSSKCPGSIILRTYDLACALRDSGTTVISGFHSPIEKECLRLLLRGSQPIVICPARSIERMRAPREWREALAAGRLLILSPFATGIRRMTRELARTRNRLVAALARRLVIPYADPSGDTDDLAEEVASWGIPVYTFAGEENAHLIRRGAIPLDSPDRWPPPDFLG